MGLWDKLAGELIDIIQWLDDTEDTMVYRFERYGNEIKYNSKLVVREGQVAAFVNEGRLADVFNPGTYTLETRNLPVLATLQGWKYGFESPFKAEVYFCSTRQFTNLKWGTPGPCTIRDSEFGAVRVTAFGLYSIRIKDPALFVREIVGTGGLFTTASIAENLRGKIGAEIKEVLPDSGIPVVDLEGKIVQLSNKLKERLSPSFDALGLELVEVQVQDIGLPEEVERAMDKAGAIRVLGSMQAYTQYETASSIHDAANNPGGLAAAGAGVGIGLGIGRQMAGTMSAVVENQPREDNSPAAVGTLPPLPGFHVALDGRPTGPFDTARLQEMIIAGQITRETLVWKQGLSSWENAGNLSELKKYFELAPPPLPPENLKQ